MRHCTSLSVLEFWGSIAGPVKSNTVSPTRGYCGTVQYGIMVRLDFGKKCDTELHTEFLEKYGTVRKYGIIFSEKISYRTVTYGIFERYEITVRYFFRGI